MTGAWHAGAKFFLSQLCVKGDHQNKMQTNVLLDGHAVKGKAERPKGDNANTL